MHQPLQEAFYESDRARLLRWVPWLHLFRALRLATRWQNLVLALLGLFLLAAGRWGVSHFPFSAYSRQIAPPVPRLLQERDFSAHIENRTQWPWEANFLANELHSPRAVLRQPHAIAPQTILTPLRDLLSPASVLFQRRNTWSDIADAWLNILLVLAVAAVVGRAITRRVAPEFGRSIEPGLVEALRFSVRDFPFYFGAPFISVVGIGLLLLLGRIIGWIGLIPGFGETLAAFAWGPLLILALVMALIL
ncbi:MAG: hypothetical protein KDA75_09610, partial [Planctomycetaceae bacterium]|nr:hypothetical protein [Planctomycetaceae bacterium]